jgi:hypothetical protein
MYNSLCKPQALKISEPLGKDELHLPIVGTQVRSPRWMQKLYTI